jgi:hypothetical protein
MAAYAHSLHRLPLSHLLFQAPPSSSPPLSSSLSSRRPSPTSHSSRSALADFRNTLLTLQEPTALPSSPPANLASRSSSPALTSPATPLSSPPSLPPTSPFGVSPALGSSSFLGPRFRCSRRMVSRRFSLSLEVGDEGHDGVARRGRECSRGDGNAMGRRRSGWTRLLNESRGLSRRRKGEERSLELDVATNAALPSSGSTEGGCGRPPAHLLLLSKHVLTLFFPSQFSRRSPSYASPLPLTPFYRFSPTIAPFSELVLIVVLSSPFSLPSPLLRRPVPPSFAQSPLSPSAALTGRRLLRRQDP